MPDNNNSSLQKEIFGVPGEIAQSPTWADTDANKEDQKWNELDKVKRTNDKRWLTVYGWVLLSITTTFAIIFIASLVIWAWHYLTPLHFHWLADAQLSKIQSVLFSGGMGAVISGIIRNQISKAQ